MKKAILSLLFGMFFLAAGPASHAQNAEAAPSERIPVAFLGFESTDILPSGRFILAELVRHEISIAPRYELVERSDLDALLDEQELRVSDAFNPSKVPIIGKLAGADKLVLGQVGILGTLYIINLRMIDVATGKVERSQVEEFIGAVEDLRKPVRIAAQKLLGIPGIEVNQGEFISVETDPPGVGVYVNGLFEGDSPIVVRVPRSGKYAVKLAAEGYRPWTQSVHVEGSSTYFVKAKLLKEETVIDKKIKSLQDGRPTFLGFTTLYAAAAADTLLYAFSGANEENARLYIGLPLVAAPLAFYGALKGTEAAIMNNGRVLMITTSTLWGSSWGFATAFAFGAVDEGLTQEMARTCAGLSVVGGLLYGSLSTYLTAGKEPFPSSRAWLFNLGSVLGAFLGLGVPYVLNVDDPGWIYAGMLTGSLGGSALALYLTRGYSEGRNIENLAFGDLIEAGPGGARLGLPLPVPVAIDGGGGTFCGRERQTQRTGFMIPLARLWID
jgi:hypothetical protein